MGPSFEVSFADGIVRVRLAGVVDLAASIEALRLAMERAAAEQSRLMLFDIRLAHHPDFHNTVIKQATRVVDLGLVRSRLAILGRHDDPVLPFIEDVATNRALPARVFTEETAAVGWLKQP